MERLVFEHVDKASLIGQLTGMLLDVNISLFEGQFAQLLQKYLVVHVR